MTTATPIRLPKLEYTPAQAVANGLSVLNKALGKDWVNQVDLDNLQMSEGGYLPAAFDAYKEGFCGCLLAQLNYDGNALGNNGPKEDNGDYELGLLKLVKLVPCTGQEWDAAEFAIIHGFLVPGKACDKGGDRYLSCHEAERYYELLDYHWKRAIRKQRRELAAEAGA